MVNYQEDLQDEDEMGSQSGRLSLFNRHENKLRETEAKAAAAINSSNFNLTAQTQEKINALCSYIYTENGKLDVSTVRSLNPDKVGTIISQGDETLRFELKSDTEKMPMLTQDVIEELISKLEQAQNPNAGQPIVRLTSMHSPMPSSNRNTFQPNQGSYADFYDPNKVSEISTSAIYTEIKLSPKMKRSGMNFSKNETLVGSNMNGHRGSDLQSLLALRSGVGHETNEEKSEYFNSSQVSSEIDDEMLDRHLV